MANCDGDQQKPALSQTIPPTGPEEDIHQSISECGSRTFNVMTVRILGSSVRRINVNKDADPDIPILKQAKAEYAKLQ